jgi:hypothetical protein
MPRPGPFSMKASLDAAAGAGASSARRRLSSISALSSAAP